MVVSSYTISVDVTSRRSDTQQSATSAATITPSWTV